MLLTLSVGICGLKGLTSEILQYVADEGTAARPAVNTNAFL